MDQRHEGVCHRATRGLFGARDSRLRQHAAHGVMVNADLPAERADRPVLGAVQAQDLRLELARHHRRTFGPKLPVIQVALISLRLHGGPLPWRRTAL